MFGEVIRLSRGNNKNANKSYLFNKPLIEIPKAIEGRVLIAIGLGFISQLVNKNGNMFKTCCTIEQGMGRLDRESLYGKMKAQNKYGVYMSYQGINTMTMFPMLSPISTVLLNKLKLYDNVEPIVKLCKRTKLKSKSRNYKTKEKVKEKEKKEEKEEKILKL